MADNNIRRSSAKSNVERFGDMSIEIIRPANREAWLKARQQDVTASTAACLLGIHPFTTALELWAEKTGRKSDEADDNPVLRRGRILEYAAVDMIREDYPEWKVTHSFNNRYFRDTDARLGATPDCFVRRPDRKGTGLIQIKTCSDYSAKQWRDPETKEVTPPLWVAVQATIEADLTNSAYAMVALLVVGRGIELHMIDIPIVPKLMDRIRGEVADFWRLTDSGQHPEADWKRDGALIEELYEPNGIMVDLSEDNALPAICDEKARIASEKGVIEKRLKEIKAELLDKMAGASAARIADGRVITAKTVERAGYEVKPTSYIDVRVKKAGAA